MNFISYLNLFKYSYTSNDSNSNVSLFTSGLLKILIPNSLSYFQFFYLITETYKEATLKEMQKWAYEIHTSFLVPSAPLRVKPHLEEAAIKEIFR